METNSERLYVGVDVGGTKILASLISEKGAVLGSFKQETPRDCRPEETVDTIEAAIRQLIQQENLPNNGITAIGLAIPGVVEQKTGNIVVTPNMNLSGIPMGKIMNDRFGVPVVAGNDCNLGTLGECWLGSGRNAKSCVGIFIGTGIGSGIVIDGKLVSGAGQAGGEIGHLVSAIPCNDWRTVFGKTANKHSIPMPKIVCGCGNIGCFETLASRTAIERYIREAVKAGVKSEIVELCNGDLGLIKSGALSKALKAGDKLVTAVVQYAASVIGYTCLSVRHFLDPEVILLGGGVMEACQNYMMPVIEEIISADKLPAAKSNRRVLLSVLGDSAVVLGAVALAQSAAGFDPFDQTTRSLPDYPVVKINANGKIMIKSQSIDSDFILLGDGNVIETSGKRPKEDPNGFRFKDVETACEGGVELLILSSEKAASVKLSDKCQTFLKYRGISVDVLKTREAVYAYNTKTQRKAAIFHL